MPPVLESPTISPRGRHRHPPFSHRLLVSALRFLVVLAVSALIGGGWYLARKGFGREWRLRVVEELHKRGVEASIGHLTLDPFRGLVAQDVRIFDYKNHANTLALISEISLDINYAAFFHHEPFLNALDVRNADLRFPIRSASEKIQDVELKKCRAHIYFPPEQIYVSQAEGFFCGVRVSATGQLIKRANYQPSLKPGEEEWERKMSILRKVVAELQKFTFPGTPPSLQIKFSGDLAQLEDAHVEATLRGERLRRKNYELRDLFATAEWSDQTFNLAHCEWKDNAGNFAGQANWSRQSNTANFQVRSSVDAKAMLDAVGSNDLLADAIFNSPPVIDLSGSANFAGEHPRFKVIGHAAFGGFAYKAVPFSDLRAEFSWDGERTWLRDVRIRHQSGELRADLLDAPNDFRLNIDSTINPGALQAFAPPELREFLSEWEWSRAPAVHLAVRSQDRHPTNWRGEGTVALERTRFRGVWMNSASAKLSFGDGAITYNDLRVTRDEGVGTGNFTYDFAKHQVRVSNVKTSLHPAEAIFWIDPDLWKTVVLYKFRQPPTITANGVYEFRGGTKTRLEINVDAPPGMDYVFVGKTLPFDRIASRLLFTKDRLQIVDLRGSLFSGAVRGKSDISLAQNAPHHHASITVSNVNFPRLTDLYFNYKTASGELSGTYDFDGLGGDARKMSGSGKVEVTNGDVFAIPIFGPLSGILSHVLPGTAGYSIAHEATSSFTIKDGVIHTDDFEVAGKLFSMVGHGDIYFLDDKLDFDLRISPKGPGFLLAPMYKLFEYKGEGSLTKPDWHPKGF